MPGRCEAVIASQPIASPEASRGTPVNLLVSAGSGCLRLLMPDPAGRDADDVQQVLITAGFPVTQNDEVGGHKLILRTEPPGRITDPLRGSDRAADEVNFRSLATTASR